MQRYLKVFKCILVCIWVQTNILYGSSISCLTAQIFKAQRPVASKTQDLCFSLIHFAKFEFLLYVKPSSHRRLSSSPCRTVPYRTEPRRSAGSYCDFSFHLHLPSYLYCSSFFSVHNFSLFSNLCDTIYTRYARRT